MSLRPVRILAVGRLRTPHWKAAAAAYQERLSHWVDLRHDSVPDAAAALAPAARKEDESTRLLAALTARDIPVCLDEKGRSLNSRQFADLLEKLSENANRRPCFIIGGAYGLGDGLKGRAAQVLSLGSLTFPHELARVLLLEQVYRAESILRRLPYHHD